MTIQALDKKPVFKFYVPSLTREKRPIHANLQKAYIETIQSRALKQNNGFTKYNGQGGYLANDGSIISEPVLIIETYGENLFTDHELSEFCRLLEQEQLFVHESDISKAYLYDGESKENIDFYQEVILEGDIVRYYKESVPFGKGYKITREIMDSEGNTLSFDTVRESELCSATYYEDQSILNMKAHFGISL
jgi:hypothetical protein